MKRKRFIFKFLNDDSEFSIFEVIIVVFISIIFGVIVGASLTYTRSYSTRNDSGLKEIISTYNSIKDNYYKDVDTDKLTNGAIEGMVNSLGDNYSNYMNNDATDAFNESVDGKFVGIGVSVVYDGEYNKIVSVDSSGDAYGKLKVNDVIVSIDGKSAKGIYGESLSKLIRGKSGSKVTIEVLRNGKEMTYNLKRGVVEIKSVNSHIFKSSKMVIGYISVSVVAENTYKQFVSNLNRLEKNKIDSLIIDLRDNPGGHLSQTKDILSLFFGRGTVLYQIKDKSGKHKIYSTSNEKRKYPIVVLVNESSASAAEVMASCFKDNYKDVSLVGVSTYGKGTVQQSLKLSTGTSFKYTTEEWLTSKGRSINKVGIKPDYIVNQGEEYLKNQSYENDRQLQKGLEILKEKD